MRNVALFFLVLLASLSVSIVVLVNDFDSTLLNKEYTLAKIGENGLYETFIDSMSASIDVNSLDIKGFVEVIRVKPEKIEAEKAVVSGVVSSLLSYLRDPSVQTIEFGLPSKFFSPGTTISTEDLLSKDALSALARLKWAVQIAFAVRSVCLLLALGSLALIAIIARKLSSKARWLGVSLLLSGVFVLLFSAIACTLLTNAVDAVLPAQDKLSVALSVLFQSMLSGFAFLTRIQGTLFIAFGALLFLIPFFLVRFSKRKKKTKTTRGKV